MTNLPYRLEKSFALTPNKRQESDALIMENSKTKISVFYNSMILLLMKIFIYGYQFFEMIVTIIYSFVLQKIIINSEESISQAGFNVKNFNDTTESLDIHSIQHGKEREQVSSYFKNMKMQIKKQEENLNNNLIEINNLKAKINEANLDSIEQNEMTKSIRHNLEIIKQQLFNFETKLTDVTRQIRSLVSSETAKTLQTFCESDENYISIINHIRDINVKIQQQDNQLKLLNGIQISETSIDPIKKVSSYQLTMIQKNVVTLEKEIQASINIERNDASCQTTKQPFGTGDDSTLQKTIDNLNSAEVQHKKMKETSDAYKLEKELVEKSHGKLISELNKEIALLKTKIKEKDSNNATLTNELQVVYKLKQDNVNLKELEHEERKKVTSLKEELKIVKESFRQKIALSEKQAEKYQTNYMSVNKQLIAEREAIKHLRQQHKIIIQHLEDKIKAQETKIAQLRNNNDMLKNTYEALDKKFKDTKLEYNDSIKKKDQTILSYKLTNKSQGSEINSLKEEVKNLNTLLQQEKEKHPTRKPLQGNCRSRSSLLWKNGDSYKRF